MRISDAKVGDVLRGRRGSLWVRGDGDAAWCVFDHGPTFSMETRASLVEAFGPFTRLVPEEQGTEDAK